MTFGKQGVETVHPLGDLNDYDAWTSPLHTAVLSLSPRRARSLWAQEQGRLKALLPVLKEEIEAGLDYAKDTGKDNQTCESWHIYTQMPS